MHLERSEVAEPLVEPKMPQASEAGLACVAVALLQNLCFPAQVVTYVAKAQQATHHNCVATVEVILLCFPSVARALFARKRQSSVEDRKRQGEPSSMRYR